MDVREHCDDTLPTEMNGIKLQRDWYYLVDKKKLEPYINEDEKDSNYKSIQICLDCMEHKFSNEVLYIAEFFTDIKRVGISGSIVATRGELKDKEKLRKEFLEKLHETLPKLDLRLDIDKLMEKRDELKIALKNLNFELEEVNHALDGLKGE